MRIIKLLSACAASAMVLALFDATVAEARQQQRTFRAAPRVKVKPVVRAKPVRVQKRVITKAPKAFKPKLVTKGPKLGTNKVLAKGITPKFVPKGSLKLGKVKIGNLPVHKPFVGNALFKGRLGVPKNIKPKLTLTLAPKKQFQMKLSPFVQKHWKKAFFWVAVAGVGYVTVPEYYYPRFVDCVNLDDPDYDGCVGLLSYAAIEEEEWVRVREPMPPSATYRYQAKAVPPKALLEPVPPEGAKETAEVSPQAGGIACTLAPFVERKWNRAYVWVQVPELGNVTVPEDYYDRFHGAVSAEPANYLAACQTLVEAAAADMMATTSIDEKRNYQ